MFSFEKRPINLLDNDFKKQEDNYKYLELFSIDSDSGLVSFIINRWGYNTSMYQGRKLREVNPKLYNEIVSGNFITEFSNYIDNHIISSYFNLFKTFNNSSKELKWFSERVENYGKSVEESLKKKELTDFSAKYINIVVSKVNKLNNELFILFSADDSNNSSESDIVKTVFGINYEFVKELHNLLCDEFIEKISFKDFLNSFKANSLPKNEINIYAPNQVDLGHLIEIISHKFIDEYRVKGYINDFWSERFLFKTKQTKASKQSKKWVSDRRSDSNMRPKNTKLNPRIKQLEQKLSSYPN